MEKSCFVPITSAEHAMSVVLALRSKNRSVAEVHPGRPVNNCFHEADQDPSVSFTLDQFNDIVRQKLQAIQLTKEKEEQRRGWEQMIATDEALLLSMRQNQAQSLPPGFNRSGDDSSCDSNEDPTSSSPTGLLRHVTDDSDVQEEDRALDVGGAVKKSAVLESTTDLDGMTLENEVFFRSQKREQERGNEARDNPKGVVAEEESRHPTEGPSTSPGRASKRVHGTNARRHTHRPRSQACEKDGHNVPKKGWVEPSRNAIRPAIERCQEDGAGAGLSELSGCGGGGGGGGGSLGGNLSDASWSSSDDSSHASTIQGGVIKRRGPAFHGVDDWTGTSPYGSDDDGVSRSGVSAAKKNATEAAWESSKGSRSGWEPASTKQSHKVASTGVTQKGQGRVNRATREDVGRPSRAVPPPSLAALFDGATFGGRVRDEARAPTRQKKPSKRNQAASKQKINVNGDICKLSPTLRAAAVEIVLPGSKQRPANTTQSSMDIQGAKGEEEISPISKRGAPCRLRAARGRQGAHNSSACCGGSSVEGEWGDGVGQQKERAEMGAEPSGGGNDTGTRGPWMHQQPLRGGHSTRRSGDDGDGIDGGKEGRREHGGADKVVGGGVCSSDESWVVREFKARVEAARRQEDEL